MQVPAQPLLRPTALVDEIITMIDQQLELTKRLLIRARTTQPRLAQRGSRDSKRIDRVGLAPRATRATLGRHQLRRHSHELLALSQQPSLQRPSQLPTVLKRPQPIAAQLRRPGHELTVDSTNRLLLEHPPGLIDCDRRQRVLVHVHSDHDHLVRLLHRWGRPASGQASLEAAAKLLSGHARRSREGGGDTTLASQPSGDMREKSQRPPPESLPLTGRHHDVDNDSECGNVPRISRSKIEACRCP